MTDSSPDWSRKICWTRTTVFPLVTARYTGYAYATAVGNGAFQRDQLILPPGDVCAERGVRRPPLCRPYLPHTSCTFGAVSTKQNQFIPLPDVVSCALVVQKNASRFYFYFIQMGFNVNYHVSTVEWNRITRPRFISMLLRLLLKYNPFRSSFL